MEIDAFRRIADLNRQVRISVEPKPSDPRRVSTIKSMADALLAAREVDRANFGVTLDYCHLLMAGERPAAAAALALRYDKLFGVHLNDGYGPADDGLMVGSVTFWNTLELLAELRQADWSGVVYFDTFPERDDPAAECAANVAMVRRMERILDRFDWAALAELRARQDAAGAMRLATRIAFGDDDG